MLCKKCKKEIPDESTFCLHCGRKQEDASRKEIRRTNGAGSVIKLSGKRRKPWAVRISEIVDGKQKYKYIGTYEKESEAKDALYDYNRNGISELHGSKLKEIYDLWKKNHFETISEDQIACYSAAWNYYKPLHNRPIEELKAQHYQSIVDNAVESGKSRSTCEKIKQLCGQLCKYAMNNDLIDKNYATFIVLPKAEKSKRTRFTEDAIEKIKEQIEISKVAQIVYVLIYSGLRINELFSILKSNVFLNDNGENYMIGGEKTEEGKDRFIPIKSNIIPIIKKWYNNAKGKYLICSAKGCKINDNNFRKREYYPFLKSLDIDKLTPHCSRHTFASKGVQDGVDPQSLKEIMGIVKFDTISDVYAHANKKQLIENVEKIK